MFKRLDNNLTDRKLQTRLMEGRQNMKLFTLGLFYFASSVDLDLSQNSDGMC